MTRPQRDLGGPPRAADRRPDAPEVSGVSVGEGVAEDAPPAPWHFKVLLFATAGYLVYRLIWFIFWLTGHAWHG